MTSSVIPTVTDALVSVLDAALSIPVYDGAIEQNVEAKALTVGAALADSDFAWEQQWATLAAATRPREEQFDVPCCLWVRSGDKTLSTYRSEVFGYWQTVESALRTNPTLGITTNSLRTLLRPLGYSQPRTPEGVVCRIDFAFRVKARI